MHSPGKLLLSAVVALLLLGDAVTRTTATTTSNAFLRAAVDTRTSEEPGSVKGNPKLDEERGFENLTSWLRGWGSSGRSSSVKKQLAKNPSTMNLDEVKARLSMMGTEMTSKQRKEEKKRLSEVSNVPTKRRRNLPAHFKKISEGKEEKRNELFKVWMGDGGRGRCG
uniref:RxLR effector candidate protein n=1 Tax=Hyaloperonospora arabidopsidis (strain Emoy2) TaxID=559515 RepID=M4BVR8_HYAAE